jgi:hypothetical protein
MIKRMVEALLVVGVFCALALPVHGQTLADVARQEEARRRAIKKPAKIYTNASLRPGSSGDGIPAGTAPASAPAEPAAPATEAAPAVKPMPAGSASVAPAEPAKGEAYWRKRVTDVRDQRDRNAVYLESLENRINSLWADFTARDDPAQRAVIAQNRQRALDERDRLKKEQLAIEKQIKDIEEEARRANVPPGWLR